MTKPFVAFLAAAALSAHAQAQVLIDDTFSSGNITNWYSAGPAGTSVTPFNAGGGNEYLSINGTNVAGGAHAFRACHALLE